MFSKKVVIESRRDDELILFCLLSNHTILDLLVAYSTKDTKVDQPVNYDTLSENV